MKVVIVNSKDLFNKTENPTACLSALRACNECHQCNILTKKMIDYPLDEALKKLKCKPRISDKNMKILKEYDAILTKKEDLLNEIEIIQKRLGIR
jgi:hypothetical protein